MIFIEKPKTGDSSSIKEILSQWTMPEEVEKYLKRIIDEIEGKMQFNLQFWVAKEGEEAVGIVGLCDSLPKIMHLAKTDKSGEIKILYVNGNCQQKGIGRALVQFIEKEAKHQGYKELVVRSATQYKFSAYGFYEKMGYEKSGIITNKDKSKKMQVFMKLL